MFSGFKEFAGRVHDKEKHLWFSSDNLKTSKVLTDIINHTTHVVPSWYTESCTMGG